MRPFKKNCFFFLRILYIYIQTKINFGNNIDFKLLNSFFNRNNHLLQEINIMIFII